MGVNTKVIKRRIKSVGNTKKITKAMEMISAVKMRRAVAIVLATRSYAKLAWEMLTSIAEKTDVSLHPLLTRRKVKQVGVILITSNRGLAGGFTSRMLQEVDGFIRSTASVISNPPRGGEKSLSQSTDGQISLAVARDDNKASGVKVLLTGRKGRAIYKKFGHEVVAEFDKEDITTKMEEILPMAQLAVKEYISGKYDKIVLAYTDFVSAVQQIPRVKQILPLTGADALLGEASPHPTLSTAVERESNATPPLQRRGQGEDSYGYGYKFEPNPNDVLNILLPKLVEMQVYQAILESDASEHSARMMAMRNASDAARDMIKELQYNFNKARQAAITQEISEIVGGAAALG